MLPITAPIRASEISAEVELTPPTSDGAEVQETVTQNNIVDIQRYLRWADHALDSQSDQRGTWRRLTASELLLHFRFDTVVAHWFVEKTAEWDSNGGQQELRKT